ncbi:unnamed protein product [Strongylus vulgaris]|uniref:G-protein coupled receptors family 1 profile domain-containing protein n=1 Tax=Strongylus vulgaris TaxID=40348 RepID=A0A3P7KNL1_STRVU|nr:unnamed protein product [Strongylus vulgaris]
MVLSNATNAVKIFTEDMPLEDSLPTIYLEGSLILLVSLIGLICNFLSFLVMIRHRTFRNSFGYLTAYHALSNAAVLFIFLVWAVPWTILPIPQQLHSLNFRIGQLSLFFVETAFHCCLCMSVNRFIAITFPMQYRQIFSDKITSIIIVFVTIISALYWGVYFWKGCDFYFDHKYRAWSFGSDSCSVWLSHHIDMGYNVCLFLLVGLIDFATLLQLRSMTKTIILPYLVAKIFWDRHHCVMIPLLGTSDA